MFVNTELASLLSLVSFASVAVIKVFRIGVSLCILCIYDRTYFGFWLAFFVGAPLLIWIGHFTY